MLDAKDYPPGTPIYSFVAADGTNTHIDSEKLRQWCATNKALLRVYMTPIKKDMAMSFIMDNVVVVQHVRRIMQMPQLDPIIYGITGINPISGRPDVLLIDGHHRYVASAVSGVWIIPAYMLTRAQWEPFQIQGVPDMTEEQLRRAPSKIRK